MRATRVFLGVRRHGVLTCFETWTRGHACDDEPHILLARLVPPISRLGLDRVAMLLESIAADKSAGLFENAIEWWFEAVEAGEDVNDSAGEVVPSPAAYAGGIVVDMDARALDWLCPSTTLPTYARGVDAHGFVAALRVLEVNLEFVARTFESPEMTMPSTTRVVSLESSPG